MTKYIIRQSGLQLERTSKELREISLTAVSVLNAAMHSDSSAESLATSLQKMVGLIQLFLTSV